MAVVEDQPKRQVTLAYPLEHDGAKYDADSTVALPEDLAIELLFYGRAREPEADQATEEEGVTNG